MDGDHFMPWFHDHAHAQQAWVWLAAAAQATKRIPMGPAVTIPMFKYHRLNIAHAFVTIENMFPGRVILGVGTGEAMNGAVFVPAWPPWKTRGQMLCECGGLQDAVEDTGAKAHVTGYGSLAKVHFLKNPTASRDLRSLMMNADPREEKEFFHHLISNGPFAMTPGEVHLYVSLPHGEEEIAKARRWL